MRGLIITIISLFIACSTSPVSIQPNNQNNALVMLDYLKDLQGSWKPYEINQYLLRDKDTVTTWPYATETMDIYYVVKGRKLTLYYGKEYNMGVVPVHSGKMYNRQFFLDMTIENKDPSEYNIEFMKTSDTTLSVIRHDGYTKMEFVFRKVNFIPNESYDVKQWEF